MTHWKKLWQNFLTVCLYEWHTREKSQEQRNCDVKRENCMNNRSSRAKLIRWNYKCMVIKFLVEHTKTPTLTCRVWWTTVYRHEWVIHSIPTKKLVVFMFLSFMAEQLFATVSCARIVKIHRDTHKHGHNKWLVKLFRLCTEKQSNQMDCKS